MRREWIEIESRQKRTGVKRSPPPCGGSGLKWNPLMLRVSTISSPSMRREWIEISYLEPLRPILHVSLHAEGVD